MVSAFQNMSGTVVDCSRLVQMEITAQSMALSLAFAWLKFNKIVEVLREKEQSLCIRSMRSSVKKVLKS